MDGRHRSLSLVIPAYNEAAGIGVAIAEADEALASLCDAYEILIVDDGSTDDTAAVVAEATRRRPSVRLLQHKHNRGYGAALATGFAAARYARVAFTDADCQFHLTDLAPLYSLTEQHPIAVGYRMVRRDPWPRRFISWGYNLLARSLLGTRVRDCDCALKVFRRDALQRLLPDSTGFFVNTEMLTRARLLNMNVAEVGVRHRSRVRGSSKVSLREIPRTLATLLPFWWSRVLFAGGESDKETRRQGDKETRRQGGKEARRERLKVFGATALLALMAGLLFFTRLSCPLLEPEEARYAEIPRQMLAEGRWIEPVWHGAPYYQKPPLLYWLIMGSYSFFGVHDWAARLVPATASLLTVLVTFWWGKRVVGLAAGFAGAMLLCLSARFVYLGRMLTMDGLLCLWVVASLAMAHAALARGTLHRGWWLLSAVACGLGLLTKGPVAFVLVLVPLLVYQGLDRRSARMAWPAWLTYGVVAVSLAAPWYVAMAARDGAAAGEFFWLHNLQRFVDPVDHARPPWFYLPNLIVGMLPWSLLLVPLARFLTRHSARTAARRPPALGFFLLASLWCLLFYSAAGCKRPGYILPAMPPLALALGTYLAATLPRRAAALESLARLRLPAWWAQFAHRTTMGALGAGVAGCLGAIATGLWSPAIGVPAMVVLGTVGAMVLQRGVERRLPAAWAVCGATVFMLLLTAVHEFLPAYHRRFALRGQVRLHQSLVADGRTPVVCYPHRWDSVSFYLRSNDVRVYTPERQAQLVADLRSRPRTLVFVKSERYLDDLLSALPASLVFVPFGRQGTVVTSGFICRRAEMLQDVLATANPMTMEDSAVR
jgi:dolichol-phosphate mannosyltransferase